MMKNGILWTAIILAVIYFFPWRVISWGKMTLSPERTVTVTGYAESKVTNQIANFTAGVSTISDSKETAVNEANKKMTEIIKAVKNLGVEEADIQTSQINVYQMQTIENKNQMELGGKVRLGQWSANYTLEITLKDPSKAVAMTDALNASGATNVYGPNFSLDTSSKVADLLIGAAVEDSKTKALEIAKAGGAKLGKMISVNEGYSSPNVYPMMAKSLLDSSGPAPAPVEIGSTNINKTVTVVWGLE